MKDTDPKWRHNLAAAIWGFCFSPAQLDSPPSPPPTSWRATLFPFMSFSFIVLVLLFSCIKKQNRTDELLSLLCGAFPPHNCHLPQVIHFQYSYWWSHGLLNFQSSDLWHFSIIFHITVSGHIEKKRSTLTSKESRCSTEKRKTYNCYGNGPFSSRNICLEQNCNKSLWFRIAPSLQLEQIQPLSKETSRVHPVHSTVLINSYHSKFHVDFSIYLFKLRKHPRVVCARASVKKARGSCHTMT